MSHNGSMEQGTPLILRPRLLWRYGAPAGSAFAAFEAATAASLSQAIEAGAVALGLGLWTSYLWSAQLEVIDHRLVHFWFGRSSAHVRLDSLISWNTHYTGLRLPSVTLDVVDTDGRSASVDVLWWSGWSRLKELVSTYGVPIGDPVYSNKKTRRWWRYYRW